MEIEFSFEDDGSAGIWRFICTRDHTLSEQADKIVGNGVVVECPECHRKYQFTWKGMIVEELKQKCQT